jgi:hypothetical protein
MVYLRHYASNKHDIESVVEIFKRDVQLVLSLPPERDAYLHDGYAAFLTTFAQRFSRAPALQGGPTTSNASIISYQVGTRTTMPVTVGVTAPINDVLIQ